MAKMIKVPGIGPVKAPYVYAGIGVTVGILALAYWRAAAAPDDGGDQADVADVAEPAEDPFTQFSDAAGYNTVYPPVSAGDDDDDDDPPTSDYRTNAEWSASAIGIIAQGGVTEQAAYQAVSGVLAGLPVTAAEQQMFLRAVGVIGDPPGGYPKPIRTRDTPAQPTPPPKAPPGKSLPAPSGLRVAARGKAHIRLEWNDVKGAVGYAVFIAQDPPGGGTPTGIRQGTQTVSRYTAFRLKAGTRYRFDIHAVGRDGQNGRRARIYAYTTKR